MNLKTLTTGNGVETEINLTYLPEYIAYEAATQLAGLKVEVLGEGVIVDLDADGLSTIGRAGVIDWKTNGYVIPLANGLIKGKNVVMTFTNSAAQTPVIRGWSDNNGNAYVKSVQQKVFAQSGIDIPGKAFQFISFENGTAASDELNVTFVNPGQGSITQKMTLEDVQIRNAMTFQINQADEDYYFFQDGTIGLINYIPNSDTVLYIQNYVAA